MKKYTDTESRKDEILSSLKNSSFKCFTSSKPHFGINSDSWCLILKELSEDKFLDVKPNGSDRVYSISPIGDSFIENGGYKVRIEQENKNEIEKLDSIERQKSLEASIISSNNVSKRSIWISSIVGVLTLVVLTYQILFQNSPIEVIIKQFPEEFTNEARSTSLRMDSLINMNRQLTNKEKVMIIENQKEGNKRLIRFSEFHVAIDLEEQALDSIILGLVITGYNTYHEDQLNVAKWKMQVYQKSKHDNVGFVVNGYIKER